MSSLRIDPITGESVVFAVERSQRPSDLKIKEKMAVEETQATGCKIDFSCPFCPGQEQSTPPEISIRCQNGQWQTRTFENKYPIFTMNTTPGDELERIGEEKNQGQPLHSRENSFPKDTSLLQESSQHGAHLVIVEHPNHNQTFFQMSSEEMLQVLIAYQEANQWVAQQEGIHYILTFKNYQRKAGASLHHPHSQVLGTSFIPDRLQKELDRGREYRQQTGNCIFCDLIAEEIQGERQIRVTENYLVLAPYASRLAYETWILPRAHQAQFMSLTRTDLIELAELLVDHFQNLHRWLGDFPFNLFIHVGPIEPTSALEEDAQGDFHWHIEILPRISSMAGFELGGGVQVNSVLPENVANLLRQGGERE